MKKINTKLQFRANTVRVLQDDELSRAAGGDPRPRGTMTCSQQCGCTSHPPDHPPGSGHHGNHGN